MRMRIDRANAWALVACAALAVGLAWHLGQEVAWDLRNYHFYTPWLLADGRFTRDIEPAGVQTYLNPIFDLPFYVLVRVWQWPPLLVGSCLAAFHGLNLWLVFIAVRLTLAGQPRGLALSAAGMATAATACGAAFRTLLGGTSNDNTVCVFALTALVLVLRAAGAESSENAAGRWRRAVCAAGLLIGVAIGGKPTGAMYGAGLFAAVLIGTRTWRARLARAADFVVCAGAGAIATGGYWMWLMRQYFGHPLFPFRDATGAFAALGRQLSATYSPRNLWQEVFYPFYFVTTQSYASEAPFRDARFAVAYVAVVVFTVVLFARKVRGEPALRTLADRRTALLVTFTTVAYLAWLQVPSVYRYAVGLELVTAAVGVAVSVVAARSVTPALIVIAPVSLGLMLFTDPGNRNDRVRWSSSTYFGVSEAALAPYAGATILMTSFPNAYVAPFFPSSTSFVRLASNWNWLTEPPQRARITTSLEAATRERLYLLDLPRSDLRAARQTLVQYGLTTDGQRCSAITTTYETGRICAVIAVRDVDRQGSALGAYEGYQDPATCTGLVGWAWDRTRPDEALRLDVYDGETRIGTIVAAMLRPDLVAAGKGNGHHAFSEPLPAALRNGRPHRIDVRYAGSDAPLIGEAATITCAPAP